jgi:transposase
LVLTPGQRHEAVAFAALLECGAGKRIGRGRPTQRPRRVAGDKGDSRHKMRLYLRQQGIRLTIPPKQNEWPSGPFDRSIYRLRERMERLINRLKQHRRLATRYDKCAANYRAMGLIAAPRLWL